MMKGTVSKREENLSVMREYKIIDPGTDFSCILESIATICEVPLSTIVRVTKDNLEVVASAGVKMAKQHKRHGSCSQYALEKGELCEIEDIRNHDQINDNTNFEEDFEIRFFAAYPLKDELGNSLGTFNIYDSKPRVLTEHQRYLFVKSAESIIKLFTQNRHEQRLLFFDRMFDRSKDIIGIVNFDGVVIKVNSAITSVFGYEKDEILNRDMFAFLDPGTHDDAKKSIERLTAGMDEFSFTFSVLAKNKETKWVEWTSTPEQSTELIYFVGRDKTEVYEKELLLKNSEARFRAFFENSQNFMMIHDMQGDIISINKSGAMMFGYQMDEIEGINLHDYVPSSRWHILRAYLKALQDNGETKGEAHLKTASGEESIWFYNSVVEKNGNAKSYVLVNGTDLTEHYKMEDRLKIATKRANKANRAKSEFIANMSHEIRTPLNGVIGFTDLMLKTPLDNTQEQYLRIINQSGMTLLDIINQILDFSKIESRKITLSEEKVDLQCLASDAFAMVSFVSEKKGLEMLIDFKGDIPRFVWADEIRLKQVLVNLLSNAVKFTDEGEIKLQISLKGQLPNGNIVLHFGVHDTGRGIHEDKIDQIFNAFEQEDSSITKKYGGTGLGLSISNSLLELMGSKLKVESKLNKGSTFSFELKLKAEKDEFDDELLKHIKRVLVVDDNDSNRLILKRVLELKNIEVDDVDSGFGALSVLQKNAQYDVIIMDYHMPVMDGIETIRKIKEDIIKDCSLNEQPIIMLYSSSDSEKLQAECDRLDIKLRLVKPIKMQKLFEMLAKLKDEGKQSVKVTTSSTDISSNIQNRPMTILIAEDNKVNMYLTKIMVQQLAPNSQIVEATDGVEAVSLFFEKKPDFVLMDLRMPNMNGYEATKQIRMKEAGRAVPIVALTAGNMSGEKEKCLEIGMNDFMTKPIVKKDLANLFNKWMKTDKSNDCDSKTQPEKIEHLNKTWFYQFATDDSDFKKHFTQLAKEGIAESARALHKGIINKDLEALNATGHKLKGTCLAVGLTQLSKLAIAFELLDEFDDQSVSNLYQALLHEISIVNKLLIEQELKVKN